MQHLQHLQHLWRNVGWRFRKKFLAIIFKLKENKLCMISSTTQSLFRVYSGIIWHKNVLFPHVKGFALICCPFKLPNSSRIVQLLMDFFPFSKNGPTIGHIPSFRKLSWLFILSQWSSVIRATALLMHASLEKEHVTRDTWHMTHDIWHMTGLGR